MAATFPLDRYIDFGLTICDMDRRGLVTREKCGSTRLVTLNVKE